VCGLELLTKCISFRGKIPLIYYLLFCLY